MEIDDCERYVVSLLRRRAGVEVDNLSWVTYLPTAQYLAALEILDATVDTEVPKPARFISRMCFSNSRAKRYYRRIFGWWAAANGDTEPCSLELALCRTYSKKEGSWTWEQLRVMPSDRWPFSLLRRLWNDGAPRHEIRNGLLSYLSTGSPRLSDVAEIMKIGDPELQEWFIKSARTSSEIEKILNRTARKRKGERDFTAFRIAEGEFAEVFSAEVDDDEGEIGGLVREVNRQLGWKGEPPRVGMPGIFQGRLTLLWADKERDPTQVTVATREDETTVVIQWLAKPGLNFPAVRLS